MMLHCVINYVKNDTTMPTSDNILGSKNMIYLTHMTWIWRYRNRTAAREFRPNRRFRCLPRVLERVKARAVTYSRTLPYYGLMEDFYRNLWVRTTSRQIKNGFSLQIVSLACYCSSTFIVLCPPSPGTQKCAYCVIVDPCQLPTSLWAWMRATSKLYVAFSFAIA